jgi:subtilase family serine protease
MLDVASKSGAFRGTPDVAFDADMASGVAIYDSTPFNGLSGWLVIGGTSLAAPCWAAIAALMGGRCGFASTADFCEFIYSLAGKYQYDLQQCYFYDITMGMAGTFSAMPGWDFCTGLGTPRESHLVSATCEEDMCTTEENSSCEDIENGTDR